MPGPICVAQFVGFAVEVTCKVCGAKLSIPNDWPKRAMDKKLSEFNRDHEKAHKEGT